MAEENKGLTFDSKGLIRMPERFSKLAKLITRDLNHNVSQPKFFLYSKDDVNRFLRNPYRYSKQLRHAAIYMYGASAHFRRLIQYFTGLTDWAYVLAPYKVDTSTANPKRMNTKYRKTLNTLSSMDIKNQFPKILTVCLREDVFYGHFIMTNDTVTVQQLPSDYCDLAVLEGNVLNVMFDFSYFDAYESLLEYYDEEFRRKYELFKEDRIFYRWQELDAPRSFAIKCNNDILDYPIPPFAGIFREIYDLEDYKQLKLTKTELENYAMLVMNLGINSDGEWEMDLEKARAFYQNLANVLPDEVGAVLSPMEISKISFERNHAGDTATVADAEQNLYSAAGVSSLLFNNVKASSNALLLAIKADQMITYGIVKSIETAVNRFIQSLSYGKQYKITFLDVSTYNRDIVGTQYLKACQYGLPMITYYCASQGLSQADLDAMTFLETEVLELPFRFVPLQSSNTMASDDGGRPESTIDELTDNGEISRENEDGDNSEVKE